MPHVLVAGKLHPKGRALLDTAPGVTVRYIDEISEESYSPYISEADALLIRTQPLSARTIAQGGRLRIVSRHGVGYDAVDVDALSAQGIALAVCGDVNSYSVAEHACMMILAASKRAVRADGSVRIGPWGWRNSLESQDLRGRNLLILGFGRIGQHTATMMGGFGMTIRAFDPYLASQGWPAGQVACAANLSEALAWADVISVSAPKGARPLIGAAEFEQMKPGVVVVNTARGGIMDEAALIDALRSGKVGAAGLDVFETEPLPETHPLRDFTQVILSPHIAGVTEGASERMAIGSAQNILDFFSGTISPDLVVNGNALHHVQET
ncbi:hydroxyacid dehydrogenase [Ponticoccus sp. SC2-23]|uniref:hydroxyacid dehydrogenase n=1 Tax=Alexandriicola marinus TaxID=2081710 RepID=UPI000FDC9B6E|nr:hydroxyacid dehydrogenase [Alexandriicola marinus]MBM1222419.1 hydroxyacid dehydrogenase [Ponticoccus sp. SC6-9]MBM1224532.1 hydroxyacid dehydrogenase [Ponticoccus sp. SC6-15]MBM1229688.1 hydroxyacid dehydrogenase [Ponticoccus sp. SC6-38]MBM1233498.1 hydroxyacid dehydrogenase [Ponticoccus sp. SC6-45]MBM1236552.1 hydroxyacid dehydrogenase [Ponticoccus sp. SC6-49]MBM1244596.1 hydroxyacid dehydrogenase [Ponticoccus sp. SC2-64]MBM1247022.1 hydroxyacid dehydrogenase [Ponticoccus sp. SC6-42]MB